MYNEVESGVRQLGLDVYALAQVLYRSMRKVDPCRKILVEVKMDDLCATHEKLCHACDIMHMWQVRSAAHMVHCAANRHKPRRVAIAQFRAWFRAKFKNGD